MTYNQYYSSLKKTELIKLLSAADRVVSYERAKLNIISSLSRYMKENIPVDQFISEFAALICETTGWPACCICGVDDETPGVLVDDEQWHILNDQDRPKYLRVNRYKKYTESSPVIGGLFKSEKLVVISDQVSQSKLFDCKIINEQGVNSVLLVPIFRYEQIRVLLQFFVDDKDDDVGWEGLIQSSASQLSGLVERIHTEQKLKENNIRLEDTINALQSAQLKLIQSEKMASLGQLAAGVAHEINNPVGFIKSNLVTLSEYVGSFEALINEVNQVNKNAAKPSLEKTSLMKICEDEEIDFLISDSKQLIEESQEGTVRVEEIVFGLKRFSHVDEEEISSHDINDGLDQTLKVIWNELKYKCDVFKDYGDLPAVNCYAGQINQVFMNLLVNASHAISKRGNIHITTSHVNGFIVVRIADDGYGIDDENISQLYDPFYTTKPVGEGTGLGLSISYGIIKKHGGTIDVESELGKGTEFVVSIPEDPFGSELV